MRPLEEELKLILLKLLNENFLNFMDTFWKAFVQVFDRLLQKKYLISNKWHKGLGWKREVPTYLCNFNSQVVQQIISNIDKMYGLKQ